MLDLMKIPALILCLAAVCGAEETAPRPDHRKLTFPEPPVFEPARPERIELENGMVVYLLEDHEFPTVTISMTFRTGSIYEPADKLGLAEITGELMRLGGTESIAPSDLDRELEDMASSVETSIGDNSGSASAWTLVENLDRTFELLADVVRRPRFDADKLELIMRQLRTAIQTRNDDAGEVASREFTRLLYGRNYPFARIVELEHLAAITRDDIVAFHQHELVPNQTIVGIVGDIDMERARALVEKRFGDWKPREQERPAPPEPSGAEGGVYFADLSAKGVSQTVVRIGHLGVRRDEPDYPAIIMMNYILGGGSFGTSRLLGEVRTNQGLAYSVYSSYRGLYDRRGSFFAGCETKGESTVAAVRAILAEIDRIRDEPVSEEELAAARREFINAEVFSYDSPAQNLSRAILYEYHHYPQDLLEQTLAALRNVTAADVQAAARKHLHSESMIILAVGDQMTFGTPLEALDRGEVHTVDISIPVPELKTETLDFTSESGRVKARELAARVVAARGGQEKILGTHSFRSEIEFSLPSLPPGMAVAGVQYVVAPDRVRMEMAAPGMTVVQVATAEGGWVKAGPRPASDLPLEQTEQLRKQAAELGKSVWIGVLDGEVEATAGGSFDEDGVVCVIVGVKEEDAPTLYHVDPATGDVLRIVTTESGARSESVLRDIKEVDGRRVPMSRTQLVNGDEEVKISVKKIEYNVEIDEVLFARPD